MKIIRKKEIQDIFSNSKLKKLKENIKENKKVIIDYREKNSLVYIYLKKLNFEIEFKELKIGDYIVKNVVIERKTIQDFKSSIINGRLIKQIEELKQYEKKVLMIEGISEQEIYNDTAQGLSSNAIRGFLLSVALKHKIPIIYTKNAEDTAKFIDILSRKKEKEHPLNAKKKTLNKKEQLQLVIESFPNIGPKKSKELLKKFGSIQNIINAPLENLREVLGKNAEIIIEIISRKY